MVQIGRLRWRSGRSAGRDGCLAGDGVALELDLRLSRGAAAGLVSTLLWRDALVAAVPLVAA